MSVLSQIGSPNSRIKTSHERHPSLLSLWKIYSRSIEADWYWWDPPLYLTCHLWWCNALLLQLLYYPTFLSALTPILMSLLYIRNFQHILELLQSSLSRIHLFEYFQYILCRCPNNCVLRILLKLYFLFCVYCLKSAVI